MIVCIAMNENDSKRVGLTEVGDASVNVFGMKEMVSNSANILE